MLDYLVLIIWAYIFPLNIIRLVGHAFIKFFRKFGIVSFFLYIILWISWAILVFMNKSLFLLGEILNPNIVIVIAGIVIFTIGLLLQVLGYKILGIKTVFGIPEILPKEERTTLVVKFPFSLVRHPIYFGQLLIIMGVLLMTAELSLCALLTVVAVFIWPVTTLEERELSDRFGDQYKNYQRQVPRIFPKLKI